MPTQTLDAAALYFRPQVCLRLKSRETSLGPLSAFRLPSYGRHSAFAHTPSTGVKLKIFDRGALIAILIIAIELGRPTLIWYVPVQGPRAASALFRVIFFLRRLLNVLHFCQILCLPQEVVSQSQSTLLIPPPPSSSLRLHKLGHKTSLLLYATARASSELLYNLFVPVIRHEAQLLVGPIHTLRGGQQRENTRGKRRNDKSLECLIHDPSERAQSCLPWSIIL